jgi:hypothetical protein
MSNTFVITEPGMTSFMLAQRFTPSALQKACVENGFIPNEDFTYAPYTSQLHKNLKQIALQSKSVFFTKTEFMQLITKINK